ncbi:uncharacterized protein LOC110774284 [Prunus avium]|uniref:Uncharacterized protein LOC110774284 n=1 Tax=Prunus avium TaxID=42229 RepID=A0A6P5U5E5_PRUAV|nr:uncharacterized protein LOC110774284 [Prunus avium]
MGAAADADAYAAEEDKTPQARQTMCICILFWLTILAGVIWLVNLIVRDIAINRENPTFRLHSATVSLLNNASASNFTATWDVTLVASNPNHKLEIYYDTIQATIFYNRGNSHRVRVLLATKPLPPPLALRTRAETTCSFRIEAASAYIGDDVAKEISEGRARGMVRFKLTLLAIYKLPSWYWKDPKLFKASCNPVEFGFSPDN